MNLLPADIYTVINKTVLTNEDKNNLIALYEPIIGSSAISLYLTLWSDLDKLQIQSKDYTHHHLMCLMKLDLNRAQESVYKFMPLPHRMEFVGIYDGVKYYNDSIATIPASTINGVETLKNVNTLIIGGKDRGIDYSDLVEFLNKSSISNLVCLPDTGWKVADLIKNDEMKIYKVQDMYKAVETAKKVTEKNTICLLSPAASSYGFFKNFQERGNLFKQLVKGEV